MRLSIRSKLMMVFGVLLLLLVLVGVSGYSGMRIFHNRLEEVGEVRLPAMDFLIEADRDLQQLLVAERSLLLMEPNTQAFRDFLSEHQENLEQSETRWQSYKKLADTPEEEAFFDDYDRARQTWLPITRKITTELATADDAKRAELLALSMNQGKAAFEQMRDVLDGLTEISLNYAHEAQKEANSAYGKSSALIIVLIIIGVLGTIIASLLLTNNIVGPIRLITEGAKLFSVGEIDVDADKYAKFESMKRRSDELGETVAAFSNMVEYLAKKTQIANEIAKGNLSVDVSLASQQDSLGKSMASMKETLDDVINAMQKMYENQKAGDIEYFIDTNKFEGAFAQVTDGYNMAVKLHIDSILLFLGLVGKYADGDFSEKLKKMPGKQIIANEIMDKLRDNLLRVTEDIKGLIQSALNGELNKRAEAERHHGEFAEIISGINSILDAVIKPVNEAAEVLSSMAEGDLRKKMEGDFKGDHAKIKKSLNSTVESLNYTLVQVRNSVEQVHSGAEQVAGASQSLSQGATEQASSLEEISSAMTEVASQSDHNADSATEAFNITSNARDAAKVGTERMKEMLSAMDEITSKSNEVKKIIKVIDEIAFQTNLLALNAAVEAARAGVHGKGFAVVAEEVRNLAQRSAVAAKETTVMIESNLSSVNTGSEIASQTDTALSEIVDGIAKVSDLAKEIADASRDQAQGVGQINQSLTQIEQVTQANTSNAEESAAASEELSSQAQHLNEVIRQFKLTNDRAGGGQRRLEAPKQKKAAPARRQLESAPNANVQVKPEDVINLDDDDFASF